MRSIISRNWQTPLIALLAFGLGALAVWFLRTKPEPMMENSVSWAKALYTCPMHPSIRSDHPDKCPICGMDLQRIDEPGDAAEHDHQANRPKTPLYYRHPMRGEITSKVPAKDEMGMDYIPVYEDGANASSEAAAVAGRSAFSLSQDRQQLIGVTSEPVEKKNLSLEIRATGKVAFDPDLFTAIEEYRQAAISASQMSGTSYGQLKTQSDALVNAAETKLKLLGLTTPQIRKLVQSDKAATDLILPGGNVWVYAEIFEYEVASVKIGQVMEVTLPSSPTALFSGKVTSISPTLNPQTRTVRVRAQVADPSGLLRPDSFVNSRIKIDLGKKLAVSNDSVLHSGGQTFVFVMKDKGFFEPRAVTVGAVTNEWTEVGSGLSEGEVVVTSANFLIDSESRLRAAAKGSSPPTKTTIPGETSP